MESELVAVPIFRLPHEFYHGLPVRISHRPHVRYSALILM